MEEVWAVAACWRNLAAAVLLQAARDLREPGYRRSAANWLGSPAALELAEMLDLEPWAINRLVEKRRRRQ